MSQKLQDLSSLTNGLEVEMIGLGAENQKKLLAPAHDQQVIKLQMQSKLAKN